MACGGGCGSGLGLYHSGPFGPSNAQTSDPNETATWLLSAGILLALHFAAVAYATGTYRHPSLFFRGFLISLVAALIWAKLVGIGSMDLGLGFGIVAGALTVLGVMVGMGLVSCPNSLERRKMQRLTGAVIESWLTDTSLSFRSFGVGV